MPRVAKKTFEPDWLFNWNLELEQIFATALMLRIDMEK